MEHFKELDKKAKEGFLRKVISPCKRLVLYNYTDKTVYEKAWNKHTLNARGTVYEIETGRVVAKAFSKFFNFSELPASKSRNLLTKENFEVFEKMDGSLGIIYYYDGSWRVNTRGSFTSDQAKKATKMLSNYNIKHLEKDTSYLVEIIYPENRIIVDYGREEKLVLLSAFHYQGLERLAHLEKISKLTNMPVAPTIGKFSSIQDLINEQEKLPAGEEGFVVRFMNGERVKFKGLAYLKVARILQGCSPLAFWESMKDGKVDVQLLNSIPEEFREEFDNVKIVLERSYALKEQLLTSQFLGLTKKLCLPLVCDYVTPEHRKKLGLYMKDNKINHSGSMFSLLLGHDIEDYVMKMIKPVGNVL